MSKKKKLLCLILAIAVLFTAIAAVLLTMKFKKPSDTEDGETAEDVGPMDYETEDSFFEDQPMDDDPSAENSKEGWEYINPYYEAFPRTENTSNFHSHATATYANINGKTVTVDTLYRQYGEALNDPNYSLGMLVYQAIQYKIAHPSEEVEIAFSAFRVSPTIALCLNPKSPYYGYVRSLYDKDYDANGFVRISYLFVEAARMGINVTIVGHLNSYQVKQYDNTLGKTYYEPEPSYVAYFTAGQQLDCYEKYAAGKKASEFLTLREVKWPYDDKTATDVMHVKTCIVSAYRDKNGLDHEYGVWFSCTNLDAVDYKGRNGNAGSQSGVIITNHKEIYNVTKNYVELTGQYVEKEAVFEFRRIVTDRMEDQIYTILAGKEHEIPENERIVYLGSDRDDVFELYFAPFAGSVDSWDTTLNPYCKYLQEFYDSDKDSSVIFCMNNPNYRTNFLISQLKKQVLEKKFIQDYHPESQIGVRSEGADLSKIQEFLKENEMGFSYIKTDGDTTHDKDMYLSYVSGGERKYVSFLSSCNFNANAMYYQTNQVLVITETEATGNVVFTSLGTCSSKGVITEEIEVRSLASIERNATQRTPQAVPLTLGLASDRSKESFYME